MFSGCSNLTSLDLSNFNTSNVWYLSSMFRGCSSLTSLDIKNFITSNVRGMDQMFYDCSSLTNLDLSNFNTYNVTNMSAMFYNCSSLTSLDVSNFNNRLVRDMSGMFGFCSSLTSLDLSNFNTSNVTDMIDMFSGCSSLTSLDLSNFNTAKVTSMMYMFTGCSNLTNLDMSNFNTTNVTSMYGMFYGCSALTSLDVNNFDVSKVMNMSQMFFSCSALTTIYCNYTWSCDNSSDMFYGCTSLRGAITYSGSKTDVTYANPDTGYFTKNALWNGNQTVTWENSIDISADKLSTLAVGDVLHVRLKDVTAGATTENWIAQAVIVSSPWRELEEGFVLAEDFTEATFTLTGDILRLLKANGLKVSGTGYTATRIYTEPAVYTGSDNSVWLGNLSGEDIRATVNFNHFKNANDCEGIGVGDIIRLTYTPAEGNWVSLYYYGEDTDWGWVPLSDAVVTPTATGADIVVTESMVSILTKDNLIIQAGNLTLTQVELIAKAPIEPYAALSEDKTTLTFYYDTNKESRGGMDLAPLYSAADCPWYEQRESITKVVFDDSFAQTHDITATNFWFCGCTNLSTIEGLGNLNTENVTMMFSMFNGCSSLTNIDVSHFNTSNVQLMSYMFCGCSSLATVDVSGFNTDNVTAMTAMFYECQALTTIDVSHFNTSNVTDMRWMFYGCSGLTSLDVSHFNTANVTSMMSMFNSNSKLSILDVSHFDTSKVEDMGWMFFNCASLQNLDVSRFNTANVTQTKSMFYGCTGLTTLDVSSFDVSKVTDMSYMFNSSSALTTIYCNDAWTCDESSLMFYGCTSLEGAIKYDENNVDVTYANPDTGYFTRKEVSFIKGDANGDGEVTITDAVAIVNKILGNASGSFNEAAADVNGDGVITITDAVGIVNIILNGGE